MGICGSRGKDLRKAPIVTVSNQSRNAIAKMEMDEQNMEKFVWETIAKGKPYTDPDFAPEQSSLYDPRIDEVDE